MEDKPTTENNLATNNIATCKPNPKDGWNPGEILLFEVRKNAYRLQLTSTNRTFDASTDLNQDEAIMAQERQIEKEIADNIPLISDKIGLEVLLNEYQFTDDESYQKKIYVSHFRRVFFFSY